MVIDMKARKIRKGSVKTAAILMMIFASIFIIVFAGINEARPDYGLGYRAFAELPSMPSDFIKIREATNKTLDYNVKEEYYKQPEFYPTFEHFIPEMKNPPADRIAIWGVGVYPARHDYVAFQESEIDIITFLHTSWMVQTYQGAKLEAEYDSRYFDVSVTPNMVLLGPAYPYFDKNWTQKITVKVRIRNAPKGSHHITLNPINPPPEQIEKWRKTYGGSYVSMPTSTPEQPYLKLTVNVK